MPLSLLIHLESLSEGQIDQFTGRGVHGFWFHRWRKVDERRGDELHASSETPPFTLSPLMGLARPQRGLVQLKPGVTAYFRITSLTDSLSDAMQVRDEDSEDEKEKKWLHCLEQEVIYIPQPSETDPGIPWKVTRVEIEAEAAYEALSKVHLMNSVPPREWRLEFLTPTTFHGTESHLPFPLPDSLVNSWMRRWNAFAPISLPRDELLEWTHNKLVVSSYNLRTLPAREGERLRVGCVGTLALRALEMPPYLRACVDLLAHYAPFCGSGSHTAQGLGQTLLKL
jgi:hypothetical protein